MTNWANKNTLGLATLGFGTVKGGAQYLLPNGQWPIQNYIFDLRNSKAFRMSSFSLDLLSDLNILREENNLSTDTCVGGMATESAATSLRSSGGGRLRWRSDAIPP